MPQRRRLIGVRLLVVVVLAISAAGPTVLLAEPAPVSGVPVRLVLPSLGVDAPVAAFSLTADRAMPVPQQASLVAWYDFSASPGSTGNVVLAGHRDWQRQRGVFFRIGTLQEGDDLWLQDGAGAWYRYTVVWSHGYVDDTAPVEAIVGPTPQPSVTLITCSGDFDRTIGRYVERQVVRAELTAVASAAALLTAEPSAASRRDLPPASDAPDSRLPTPDSLYTHSSLPR